jgi:phosphoribosylformylglycinamidine cyclo-ligase
MPPIFKLLQEWGGVEWPEMYRTFNMGVGMILMVGAKDADAVMAALAKAGETSYRIGRVTRSGEVVLKGGVFNG